MGSAHGISHLASELADVLLTAVRAAESAGRILVTRRTDFGVLRAEGKDLKTSADLAAEEVIFQLLDPLGIPVLSEETRSGTDVLKSGDHWIVDPLDGTVNYMRGLSLFCVSVALWRDGAPLLGVIHEPLAARTFSGQVGAGAQCNGQPLRVADVSDPGQAVLCTGFPTGRSYTEDSLRSFVGRVQQFKKVRLLGSAALCLAYVSAGLVDAYFEEDIWLWDVAAGLALVGAAGGAVQYGPWSRELKSRVIATNGAIPVTAIS